MSQEEPRQPSVAEVPQRVVRALQDRFDFLLAQTPPIYTRGERALWGILIGLAIGFALWMRLG